MHQKRQADPIELAGHFTPEEADRIAQLHKLVHTYPVCYRLDLNVRRLEFARWLLEHGRLDEWRDAQAEHRTGAESARAEASSAQRVGAFSSAGSQSDVAAAEAAPQ